MISTKYPIILMKVQSSLLCSLIPSKLSMRAKSSHEWLERQFSDPYVQKAKRENYRCRSAFKLLEIDDKYKILSPGLNVVDCGAAPGSWTQVAVSRVNANGKNPKLSKGKVIGIDRLAIHQIDGAILLPNSDFTLAKTQLKIKEVFENQQIDVVLSDMAPNATGVKHLDHELIIKLAYSAVRFGLPLTKKGGTCLVKIWDGGQAPNLMHDLSRFYKSVRYVKPDASRSDSAEKFILACDFKGIKT